METTTENKEQEIRLDCRWSIQKRVVVGKTEEGAVYARPGFKSDGEDDGFWFNDVDPLENQVANFVRWIGGIAE